MTYVYLAGRDLDSKWKSTIISDLKAKNEMYGTNFKIFDPIENENISHDFVSQKLHYLDKCDIMVLNMNELDRSLESIFEFSYFAIKQKPIILINAHIWLEHPLIEKFGSIELIDEYEVADFLLDIYGQ